MKRASKLICIALALTLCLTACGKQSESAETTTEATTEANEAMPEYMEIDEGNGESSIFYGTYTDTWELNTKGELVLYENFEMEDYEYSESPWISDREFVYSVKFQGDIDFIGGSAFYGCVNLTSVDIPDGVTRIGYGAFYACDSLTEVTISDSVTVIEKNAFYGCESLASVVLPNSVTEISDSAFSLCYSLESITIPAGVTELGDYVFSQCTSLTGIAVDEDNPNYADVDGVLFNKDLTELICYPLGKLDTDYEIPDGVTTIDANAFEKNETFTSVTIPASVTFIGEFAFSECPSLTDVYYQGTEAEWNEITLEKYYDYQSEFTVHFEGE
ncbi:MAG: leucine-rich repeat domain-containing protein [Oscillospiraceae bacterium]|nr:leucine-rich repeat domain-containing protein [Oscillospiraceae bacterium]